MTIDINVNKPKFCVFFYSYLLLVMEPHADNFYCLFFFIHLIYNSVLTIYASGIKSFKVPAKLFIRRIWSRRISS